MESISGHLSDVTNTQALARAVDRTEGGQDIQDTQSGHVLGHDAGQVV